MKLGQWRKKVKPQVQSGFNITWKLFLNLCTQRFDDVYIMTAEYVVCVRTNKIQNIFLMKILRLGAILIVRSSSFGSMMTDGKKLFLKILCLTLK